jgi:uncharacterized protein (PEP-CTERM system associated)
MIIMAPIPDVSLRRLRHPTVTAAWRQGVFLACCATTLASPVVSQAQTFPGPDPNGLGSGVMSSPALGGGLVNLRDLVSSPALEAPTRTFSYDASLGVFAGYTSNVDLVGTGGGTGNRRGSFMEHIEPAIGGNLDTRSLKASLHYAPDIQFYNADSAANRVTHSLSATSSAEIVADTFFINANAFATQASSSLLSTYNGGNNFNNNTQTQVYNFSVNPQLMHQFGGVGTAQLGYNFSDSLFYANNQNIISNIPANKNTSSSIQTEFFDFNSGNNFGRINNALNISASQFYGTNVQQNGHRNTASYTLSYAFNRFVTAIAEIGYEDLYYGATRYTGIYYGAQYDNVLVSRPYAVHGLTGAGGVKLTPNDDSSLTVTYGHMDGGDSLTVNGVYKPTARVTIYANSSSGVTTSGQDLANFASSANFGPAGTAYSASTGAPMLYSMANTAGISQPVRMTRSALNAVYSLDRDSWAAGLSYVQQQNLAGVAPLSGSSVSELASLSWQHQVSESLQGTVSASYGHQSLSASGPVQAGSNPVTGAVARISKALTESLSAEVDYTYARQRAQFNRQFNRPVESMNEILAGLVQKF